MTGEEVGVEQMLVEAKGGDSRPILSPEALEQILEQIRAVEARGPAPTVEVPSEEELEGMVWEGVAAATDGCAVEPDGICPHGHVSWLLKLGPC